MRKRKYLIAATLALAASVAVAAIAQATITGQKLIVSVAAKKQDKKMKGPADINITVDTAFTAPQNAAPDGPADERGHRQGLHDHAGQGADV